MPGQEITVKWPVGAVRLQQEPNSPWDLVMSADPNDHYRPWLEQNVGRQGWDWDWRIGTIAADNGSGTRGYDTLTIKFRKKHAALASFAAIKWG